MMEISGYQSQNQTGTRLKQNNNDISAAKAEAPEAIGAENNAISAVSGADTDNKAGVKNGGLNSPAVDVALSATENDRVMQQYQFMEGAENAEAVTEPRAEIENFTV